MKNRQKQMIDQLSDQELLLNFYISQALIFFCGHPCLFPFSGFPGRISAIRFQVHQIHPHYWRRRRDACCFH